MTRWPAEFPWQIAAALVVAILCFAGACFCVVVAAARSLRGRRRRGARPGYVEDFWPSGSERWFR